MVRLSEPFLQKSRRTRIPGSVSGQGRKMMWELVELGSGQPDGPGTEEEDLDFTDC